MPWYLQVAIEQSLTILSWYENLPKEDVPPEHLWEDSQGLELWWATVEERRELDPLGSGKPSARDEQGPEMEQNDLARALRKG